VILTLQDFEDISAVVPLMTKVYPNGLADVNHFHAAGGLAFVIGELLNAGLLHEDVKTVLGGGLRRYALDPILKDGTVQWLTGPSKSENEKILRPATNPFAKAGGLKRLAGSLGTGMMKVSAVAEERRTLTAPARIFATQDAVKDAFKAGEFTKDTVIVVRFQGPQANGMPELHGLTPCLTVLQDRGLNVALVTDGRMSGASGKVPSAIHISPEAAVGGPLAKLRDGDMIEVDAIAGKLNVLEADFETRTAATPDLSGNGHGIGRELFSVFRQNVGPATEGAAVVV
jgi:phosphogluconate dehydratase